MMVLVIGPNGSGKSAAAEQLACELRTRTRNPTGSLVYIATLVPADDDGHQRVINHRQQRTGLGFTTIESPLGTFECGEVAEVILLEDVSNLVANLAFSGSHLDPVTATLTQIERLKSSCCHLIAVTIGGLTPDLSYDEETRMYIDALNQVNSALRQGADQVINTSTGDGT